MSHRVGMLEFESSPYNPGMTQGNIAKHFASKSNGALIFMQCTLSRKMKSWEELKRDVISHFNMLS